MVTARSAEASRSIFAENHADETTAGARGFSRASGQPFTTAPRLSDIREAAHVLRIDPPGCSVRGAFVPESALVHARRDDDTGARHRRVDGDFLDGRRHSAAPAAAARFE